MPVALLQARYTPTSGGASDNKFLACTAGGYLYVVNDAAATAGSATGTGATRIAGSDGTYDRVVKTGAAGDVYVSFQSARPGESVTDDWLKTCLQSHYKPIVAPTGPTTVTTLTTCLAFLDCSTYGPFWIYVYNNGATLTACNVDVSYDGATGTPYTLTVKDADEIACQTLGSGLQGVAYKFARGLQGFLRIQCNCATSTAVTVALVAQM